MSAEKPVDGQVLAADARVLRLPKPPPDFRADDYHPDWQTFVPSTRDKEHAAHRRKAVRVSVWDGSRTTAEQARAFREGPTIVLGLRVQTVLEVAEGTGRAMSVVYDLLEPPQNLRPGADGHAGIEGLEKADGESKIERRARLQALADGAELLSGPG